MNHKLEDIKTKLREIQSSKKEPSLFPYLQQLFSKLGYSNVQITHGTDEYGKDLVFSLFDDKMRVTRNTAVVVKNKDAGMKDFEEGGEIHRQINTSFKFPYVDGLGKSHQINSVLLVINGSISPQAKRILEKTIPDHLLANVDEWNYQRLAQELHQHIAQIFLSRNDPYVNTFLKHQEEKFVMFNGSTELYHGLNLKDINDIYVNVRTTLKRLTEEKKAYAEYEKTFKFEPEVDPDDSIAILHTTKSYIIYGIPTSGKSLLLRRIGYNSLFNYKGKPIAPFLFELFNHQDISEFNIWSEINSMYTLMTHGDTLDVKEYSRICLLLDGIDEIGKFETRIELIKKIPAFQNWFKEEFPEVTLQIIFSTRDISIIEKNDLLSDFEKIELLPFDVGQALKLVRKLIPGSKVKAEKFVKAIKESQLSNSLTRTPMALSLMAILYRDEVIDLNELPANITELYNKFTDYYLDRWDTNKGISHQYKFEETKHILAIIAKELHKLEKSSIDCESLKNLLEQTKKEFGYEELNNINSFLINLKERSGIIIYDEALNIFSFSHLTFQEYFVSISYDDSDEESFCENYFNQWWSNVIIFYCGKQPKRDVFLKKVVKTVLPIDNQQYFDYVNLLSKCFQASYLISNATKKILTEKIVFAFDQFYKQMIVFEEIHKTGMLYQFTTLDFIVELRGYFKRLISSKHFNKDQVYEILKSVLSTQKNNYSDITLYSIANYLSFSLNDASFLQEFIQIEGLDERWQRIVFIDITRMKTKINLDEKVLRKIKKQQLKYRIYIEKQFKESAFLYLLPMVKD